MKTYTGKQVIAYAVATDEFCGPKYINLRSKQRKGY